MELFWLNGYIPNESSSCLTLYQTLILRHFCRYWMNLDWHFISNFKNAEQSGCHISSMSDVFWALLLVIVKCNFLWFLPHHETFLLIFGKKICIISLFDNCILAGPGRMWPSRWGFIFGTRVHLDTGRNNRLRSLGWPLTLWAGFSRVTTRAVGGASFK